MIELSEDPQERKMQHQLHELEKQIRECAGDIYTYMHRATVEQAEKLSQLILERNNVRELLGK